VLTDVGKNIPLDSSSLTVPLMSEVTRVLSAMEQGDPHAAEQLLPLVYEELRQLATQKLAQEKPGQTLQATALVHEAYLRLVGAENVPSWKNRGHFFGAAAEAMRRILVENARRRKSSKRGGGRQRVGLDELLARPPDDPDCVLDVDEALDDLARADPQAADLVKLRYFSGLTGDEAAAALGISPRAADTLWAYARAWLFERLSG
jgi:RNA polymerase sigma factor (TIGR02999 family)